MVVCTMFVLNMSSSFLHRYTIVFIVAFAMALIVCQIGGFMPWYMLFRTYTITCDCFYCPQLIFPVAVGIGFIFLLPNAIMTAIANVTMGKYILMATLSWWCCLVLGINVITEFIAGLIMPGDPIANVTFKTYAYITQVQASFFLSDLKLGHYMKVKSIDTTGRKKELSLLDSSSHHVHNTNCCHCCRLCCQFDDCHVSHRYDSKYLYRKKCRMEMPNFNHFPLGFDHLGCYR